MAKNQVWNYDRRRRIYITLEPDHKLTKLRITVSVGAGETSLFEVSRWVEAATTYESIVRRVAKVVEDQIWLGLTELDALADARDASPVLEFDPGEGSSA